MGSLTWHKVSILPHSNYKEISLLPSLPVERQSLPGQDLALHSFHCSQDLYNGHKAHSSPISENGYITIFLYLDDALVLANSYFLSKVDGQRVVQLLQKLGFVLILEKCQLEPTQEFTHWGLVFNTQNMTLSLSQDKVLVIKAQTAKVVSSPTCREVMRLLGLTNFTSMALTPGKITLSPLQYWLKESYKSPANLFRGLKPNQEATQTLLWWYVFKPKPKSISRPQIGAVVSTDASKEGNGSHRNNLSFWGMWPAKQGKNTHINILELETEWIAWQRFKESLRGKTVSFHKYNTIAGAYLLEEGGTHRQTLNGLVRKIMLMCHENGITVCLDYLRGVANFWADALSKGKKAQEWSLGDLACHRLFQVLGNPVVGLFASSQTQKAPNISAWTSQTRDHLGEMP